MLRDVLGAEAWLIPEHGFDARTANVFETLFTIGNGRLGTRGALEEGHPGARSGVFVAGVYDGHDSIVTDLVNAPDWVDTEVYVDGHRLDPAHCAVIEHERALDLAQGVLWRSTTFADEAGRRTRVESLRFAAMHHRDVAALRIEVTPLDHDAEIEILTGIDGARSNLEALPTYPGQRSFDVVQRWAKWARSQHLQTTVRDGEVTPTGASMWLQTRTLGSHVDLAMAARVHLEPEPGHRVVRRAVDRVSCAFAVPGRADRTVRLDKVIALRTSRDVDAGVVEVPSERAREVLADVGTVDELLAGNAAAWAELWAGCDAEVLGEARLTQAVRCGIYHLLIAANPDDPTVNIGAKSLSGEGYRGHVFWDTEVMMLPFFLLTRPETARALLGYRFHTLPGARRNSAEHGTAGARFAWESADSGDEECPQYTPDGKDRFWSREEEIHVSPDIAYAINRYLLATDDTAYLYDEGAEILFEVSRFLSTFATQDEQGVWHLHRVMGPDEFHSHIDDNTFTNVLAGFALTYAADVHDELARAESGVLERIATRIGLAPHEAAQWRAVADGLTPPRRTPDGVIEQFAGFFDRRHVEVVEWDQNNMPRYPPGYHHFNCEDTQLLKQPDLLQVMLMLPEAFTWAEKRANFEYYEPRTLHKSSLSPAIHAILGIVVDDPARAVQYFLRSAFVDLDDNQGNTHEGMHIASAAGTWMALTHGFGGLEVREDGLALHPWIPEQWEGVRYRIVWRGVRLHVEVRHGSVTLTASGPAGATVDVTVGGTTRTVTAGDAVTVPDAHRPDQPEAGRPIE